MNETLVAESKFVIGASKETVWDLIGGAIINSIPGLERMEIVDETSWRALLRVKLWLLVLNMNLKGEMIDMCPPDGMSIRLNAKSKGGILSLQQKVTIAFTSVEKDKTEVACKAIGEGMGILFRLFTLGQARNFAKAIFVNIEKRLKYLT